MEAFHTIASKMFNRVEGLKTMLVRGCGKRKVKSKDRDASARKCKSDEKEQTGCEE